jgi:hypothetical protein
MTGKEKRMSLTTFCAARSCSRCPLNKGFRCGDGDAFLKKNDNGNWSMSDKTVDKAYAIAIEKKKPTAPAVKKSHKPASAFHDCPYSSCLECDSPDEKCSSCGWNPVIKEERLERLWTISVMPPNKNGLRGLRLKRKKSHE